MLGWPLLVHYCQDCGYNTTVDYSATVWSQEHTCSHCGHKAVGADIAGKSSAEMNQSQHDELAALFSQRMTFSPQPVAPQTETHMVSGDEKQAAFVSISAHYTHSMHLAPSSDASSSEPSRSPPPSYNDSLMPEAMATLLMQNSIDPQSLLPSQVQLFRNAGDEQRLRLLELWRIAPPSYLPKEEHVDAAWMPTSMQQEEMLAKVRFETNMATRALQAYQTSWPKHGNDFDTHVDPVPISPIRAPGDPAWPPAARLRAASIAAARTIPKPGSEAEPYIVAGYQSATSVDPVYAANSGLWQSNYAQAGQHEAMAEQYGAIMQIRNHADWEAMNQQIAHERITGVRAGDGDDMMEM